MNTFMDRFLLDTGAYAPNLVGAVAALVIGLLAAWIVAAVARRGFARTQLDERIARWVRGSRNNTEGLDSARWLARGVFWTGVLITLLAFFHLLGFTPITAPLTRAFDVVVGFIPQLLAGAALGVLAFIVASFLRLLVGRSLEALRLDERLSRRPSLDGDGRQPQPRISAALAQATYWLTWLLFLPAILNALQLEGVLGPVESMVNSILAFLPNIATAGLIIVAAYLLGRIVGELVTNVSAAVGVDRLADRLGMRMPAGESTGSLHLPQGSLVPSRVLGTAIHVVIVLFAAMEAFDVIAFEQLSAMMRDVIELLGRVAFGFIIFAIGFGLSNLAARAVRASAVRGANILAVAARVAILVLSGAMALRQMGIADDIIALAFGLTIGGLAAAVAIAFGVGGREVAGRELERWVQSARAKASAAGPRDVEPAIQAH